MQTMKFPLSRKAAITFTAAIVLVVFATALGAAAQTESTIYTFTGAGDGAAPSAKLTSDGNGNFFGVSAEGGSFAGRCQFFGCGNVFELSPNGSGGWTETVLYNFTGGADGAIPEVALVFDASGNLYGTTTSGGFLGNSNCGLVVSGCGVVFKLSPQGGGTWTESVLYTFRGTHDGFQPQTSVLFDAAGNLYGTTNLGGAHFVGTIFQLSPNGSGGWSFKILYTFANAQDGGRPQGFAIDASGNLFASTTQGGITANPCGSNGCGSILELSPNGSFGWTRHIVHEFAGKMDGAIPFGLSFDANGNLFGAALFGGHNSCPVGLIPGCGVIFEFIPASGHWQGHTVYQFTGGSDGATPYAPLTFDAAGNAYGTSNDPALSACPGNCGAVFELSPTSSGFSETTLYTFTGGTDGGIPFDNGITLDSSGNLFGTTQGGGIAANCDFGSIGGCGVVYEITP